MPYLTDKLNDAERRRADREALAADSATGLSSEADTSGINLQSRYSFDVASVMGVVRHEVRGQPKALESIERMLKVVRADIADPRRPPFTALFMGPTGVGKTETIRALARGLYGDADAFCRIDMNTLSQEHYSAALTGAPPGYVGAKEGSTIFDQELLEGSRGRPGIMLFDEVEKASPEVTQALLNVFDNGQMTVASGERVYNFRNTIVFMTSNLGARDLYRHQERFKGGLGWWRALRERLTGDDLDKVLQIRLNEHFSPEFVNRIDNVTVYNWIEREMVEELVSMEVERLNRRLQKHHCALRLDKQARSELAKRGYDRQYGARALRRVIRSHVEVPFADYLLSGGHEPGPDSKPPAAYEVHINKTDVQFKRMKES